MKKMLVAAALMSALVGGMLPAHAAEIPFVTGPTGTTPGIGAYTIPAFTFTANDTVRFYNFDISGHNVVSKEIGPGNQPWCGPNGLFPVTACPVFYAGLVGLGGSSQVRGLENTEPGKIYNFYCTPHPYMTGIAINLG